MTESNPSRTRTIGIRISEAVLLSRVEDVDLTHAVLHYLTIDNTSCDAVPWRKSSPDHGHEFSA